MTVTLILGLRRSGTTVFWEWFRQDERLTCFDEPFSEQLMRLPAEHPKGVFAEYRQLVARSPEEFWRYYAPVHRAEELDADLTTRQATFLQFLAEQGDDVVLDLTRCHLKVDALAEVFPQGRFVHLIRDERAFASSHLLPSRTDVRGRVQRVLLERSFWSRTERFDFWGMEALCGQQPGSKLSLLLGTAGYDVDAFYRLPAVGRLMVLHRFLTAAAEAALAGVGRATTVRFEQFAADPVLTVARACREVDAAVPATDGSVRTGAASPGYRPTDARWQEIVHRVNTVCPVEEGA